MCYLLNISGSRKYENLPHFFYKFVNWSMTSVIKQKDLYTIFLVIDYSLRL